MEIKNVKFIYGGKVADNAVDITVENGKISKVLRRAKICAAIRYSTLRRYSHARRGDSRRHGT